MLRCTYMKISFVFVLATLGFLISCEKKQEEIFTIIIGVWSKDSLNNYVDTGNELIFNSKEDCQIWSRTAMPDVHSSQSHLHFNAATNVSLDLTNNSFGWTEYGPELDENTIVETCNSGVDGVVKSVNDTAYYQDKPNVFLKIKSIDKY